MMGKSKMRWASIPTIGRMAFLFRSLAFIYYSFVVYYHHYSNQIALEWIDYLSIIILLSIPTIFILSFHKYPHKHNLHVTHAIMDLFIIGWITGTINLTIIPSAVAIVGGITNYIGLMGTHKIYRIFYVGLGALIPLAINKFIFLFESNALLQAFSFTYGFVHFVILSYISYFYAHKFYVNNKVLIEQKSEINRQHDEIHQQAEELKVLNDSLNKLNNSLESTITERTKELNEKNKKLAQYAFFNAHKLRAPLARVIGLVQLFNYRETIKNEEEAVFTLLKDSAEELDNIVSDINKNLEKDDVLKSILSNDD